jgi:hypothetical protein
MDGHFGISPELVVMRVYAAADAQKANNKRMNEYFFKANDLRNCEFDL